jgi:hypothetical protein
MQLGKRGLTAKRALTYKIAHVTLLGSHCEAKLIHHQLLNAIACKIKQAPQANAAIDNHNIAKFLFIGFSLFCLRSLDRLFVFLTGQMYHKIYTLSREWNKG